METALVNSKLIFRKRKAIKRSDDQDIMSALGVIKNELEHLQNLFDSATEPELIDSYTYEILALETKYCYYLNLCKKLGLAAMPNMQRIMQ